MPDDRQPQTESTPVHAGPDTGTVPLGERAWRRILDHVIAVGDEVETTYLEVKSCLDVTSKIGTAKVAKFLLAAANRRPQEAARHFRGHAVLVVGAEKGTASGVSRGVEAHELEDRLRPYLGPQFPAFEFGRIGVGADKEVLFVIAQPPQEGQTIFPCHKTFQGDDRRDSLEDGAIYVRGTSNTRPARSGEVLALVERARGGGKPPIELEVDVLGPICRVDRVKEILESLRDHEEEQFSKQPEPAENAFAPTTFQLASSVFGSPGPLSAENREEALVTWRNGKAEHIAKGREHFLGAGLSGAGVRVVSRDRFVAKPPDHDFPTTANYSNTSILTTPTSRRRSNPCCERRILSDLPSTTPPSDPFDATTPWLGAIAARMPKSCSLRSRSVRTCRGQAIRTTT